ncbi:hypothetical protein N9C64_00630 [Paracoccaceae bacterium]|nr:hypothetical protein [Paracoccaceae bacterium]
MFQFNRILIIGSPFIKRVFSFSDQLFQIFNILPIFLIISTKISKKVFIFLSFSTLWFLGRQSDIEVILRFTLGLCPFLFLSNRTDIKYKNFAISAYAMFVFYGFFQYFMGYTHFEMSWIRQYSQVNEGFLGHNSRVFGMQAGMPEFTFLMIALATVSYARKKYVIFLVCAFGAFIGGTRGIILSWLTTLILFTFFRNKNVSLRLMMLSHLSVYIVLLVFGLTVFTMGEGARFLDIGSFLARGLIYNELLSSLNISSVVIGPHLNKLIFDNAFLFTYNYFGLFGLIFSVLLLKHLKKFIGNDFLYCIWIGYAFYADIILFFFLNVTLVLFRNVVFDHRLKK